MDDAVIIISYLGLPGVISGPDAARTEELDDEELAHLAPVVAVGTEGDVLVVVRQAPGPRRVGAAAAVGVARLHHLPRGVRRRHHQRGHAAQAQQHDGSVAARQLPQALVRQRAQLVQVAQDRQPRRARRQVEEDAPPFLAAPALSCSSFSCKEEQEQRDENRHDDSEMPLLRRAAAAFYDDLHRHC